MCLGRGQTTPNSIQFALPLVEYVFNTVGYTEKFLREGCYIIMSIMHKLLKLGIYYKDGLFLCFPLFAYSIMKTSLCCHLIKYLS